MDTGDGSNLDAINVRLGDLGGNAAEMDNFKFSVDELYEQVDKVNFIFEMMMLFVYKLFF